MPDLSAALRQKQQATRIESAKKEDKKKDALLNLNALKDLLPAVRWVASTLHLSGWWGKAKQNPKSHQLLQSPRLGLLLLREKTSCTDFLFSSGLFTTHIFSERRRRSNFKQFWNILHSSQIHWLPLLNTLTTLLLFFSNSSNKRTTRRRKNSRWWNRRRNNSRNSKTRIPQNQTTKRQRIGTTTEWMNNHSAQTKQKKKMFPAIQRCP